MAREDTLAALTHISRVERVSNALDALGLEEIPSEQNTAKSAVLAALINFGEAVSDRVLVELSKARMPPRPKLRIPR